MQWPATCAVVIPCFNEGTTVASLVGEVRQKLPTVIVVDDGSTDDTAEQSRRAGARVLSHPVNHGKGAALRTGLGEAAKLGFAWAFTMDGDGQHRPQDIPRFLECAEKTGARLVIGDRMHNSQAIPRVRRFVNRWMSDRISRRAGRTFPDTQCGFRLIDLAAWKALPLRTEHFEIESELLLAFAAAGWLVEFVPITVVGKGPHSHIHPVTDGWRWLKWWRASRQSCRLPAGSSQDKV